ncbi:MAG: radical SAM protein [Planctomycetaceae bacterium]|jgi:radical SAM superfamily enzyme YgiQ (UPF0313 family)|nr:radical SAM protein [Planctomycetaceae bacterium]MDP7276503.1 CUAEP/CCAEP-tail radical SAM protein [Planctomycetaceae bacterium]
MTSGENDPKARGGVLLVSCYELGRQPLGVAWPAGFLREAGFDPVCRDVSVRPLTRVEIRHAAVAVISVPMHTAMRMGVSVAEAIRAVQPRCRVVFFGLYAVLNSAALMADGAAACLGGESEEELVSLIRGWDNEDALDRSPDTGKRHQRFRVPDRSTLPDLERYAKFEASGRSEAVLVGSVEASRGCRHLCTHCPIPPVYRGRFVAVPEDVVLADIAQQVAAGARHITFTDPDFLNGPGHALRLARGLHAAHRHVSFDFTAKIEHLVERGDVLPELVDCGAAFVVTAVESLNAKVLEILHKGHTPADVLTALERTRMAGLPMRPTWMPFTPWATIDDFREIIGFVESAGLVTHVDPVQFSIRLLVPPGSLLEDHPEFLAFRGDLDRQAFSWTWRYADPRMEGLQREVAARVEADARDQFGEETTFARIRDLAGGSLTCHAAVATIDSPPAPRLTEDWFC